MTARRMLRERLVQARVSPDRGRAPEPCAAALATVASATGVSLERARARAGFARGHLLDVVLELPGGRGDETERAAAAQLCALLLGEARAADWLGEVSVVPAPRGGPLAVLQERAPGASFFPLAELPAAFGAAIRGLHAGLPQEPLWAAGGEQRWVLLELDVEPAPDYGAQTDVVLATTFLPEMLKCYLSGASFASTRFSSSGELFLYLKSELGPGDARHALAARRVLEDALDAALVTERAGRVVGSGMGVRYSYVDVAVHALDRALGVMREIGRRVGLPQRSWILFCDSALSDEWMPLHARTPPPPP